MKQQLSQRKPALLVGAALLAALALAACGGGGGNSGTPVVGGPGPVDTIDPFFAAVQGQVSVAAETTGEPIAIDSLVATSNEDKEPAAI